MIAALGLLALEPDITGVVVADGDADAEWVCPTMYGEGAMVSDGPDGTPRLTRCTEAGESNGAMAAAAELWAANTGAGNEPEVAATDDTVDVVDGKGGDDASGCKEEGEEEVETEAGDDEDA